MNAQKKIQTEPAVDQFAEAVEAITKAPAATNENYYSTQAGLASLLESTLVDHERFISQVSSLLAAIHMAHREDEEMAVALCEIGSGWMVPVQSCFKIFAKTAKQAVLDAQDLAGGAA